MKMEYRFFRQLLVFGFIASVLYSIAVYFYIRKMSYEETFILYVGNFLFAAVIGFFVGWFYRHHERKIGTIDLIVSGAKTAVAGIIMACIICVLMILVLAPDLFHRAGNTVALRDSPGQFDGKNGGFGKILFLNAILGNAGASFFISLLIPFSVMKNLYPDEKESKPLNHGVDPREEVISEENPKKNYNI
jgi:hypothetical protein